MPGIEAELWASKLKSSEIRFDYFSYGNEECYFFSQEWIFKSNDQILS